NVQDDAEMFDLDSLHGEEVVAIKSDKVVKEVVYVAQVNTATTIVTTEEITLEKALEALKTLKPKVKGVVIQEPGESTTTTISSKKLQDKVKEK
nr:hypothetical protein [Tanacetum cinerariifolium]